jgi:hypothetical protein
MRRVWHPRIRVWPSSVNPERSEGAALFGSRGRKLLPMRSSKQSLRSREKRDDLSYKKRGEQVSRHLRENQTIHKPSERQASFLRKAATYLSFDRSLHGEEPGELKEVCGEN